jgi:hypothetical protein
MMAISKTSTPRTIYTIFFLPFFLGLAGLLGEEVYGAGFAGAG